MSTAWGRGRQPSSSSRARATSARQRGREGKALSSDSIDGYLSAIKTLCNFVAHHRITLDETNVVMPKASKRMRQTQGPPGARKLKRGIRASMLRKLAAAGYDRTSERGVVEWAAALVSWNLLLRGAELGVAASM